MKLARKFFLFLLTLTFTNIAGSSSSDTSQNWAVVDTSGARTIAQGQIFNATSNELREIVKQHRNLANTLIASDISVKSVDGMSRALSNCADGTCQFTLAGKPAGALSLQEPLSPSLTFQPIMKKGTAQIGQGSDNLKNFRNTGLDARRAAVGGMLDSSFFAVNRFAFYRAREFLYSQNAAFSFGAKPTGNPMGGASGSAEWRGVILVLDLATSSADLSTSTILQGDVKITVNRIDTSPTANIVFENVKDLQTGADRTISGWTDINLMDGIFEQGSENNRIKGTFYGDNHYEAGGHFERGQVIGAFGAKREIPAN